MRARRLPRSLATFLVSTALAVLLPQALLAQHGGSRAGVTSQSVGVGGLPTLSRDEAESHITIEGQAEMRVKPTEIRVVLAVTSEGATADECQAKIAATIKGLKASWRAQGIPEKDIVEDFIAVLPRYVWKLEKRDGVDVGVEERVGFRMQSNIHLAIPNDAKAAAAFKTAFQQGITDIIAFDYWSQELDAIKAEARRKAVEAARSKSDLLLGALFGDAKPSVINVQEKTTVQFPDSLYESFENVDDQSVRPSWRRDVAFIHAHRPKNTYYRGLFVDGDVQSRSLPMQPEISVVSTVRLYFESPAAKRRPKKDD